MHAINFHSFDKSVLVLREKGKISELVLEGELELNFSKEKMCIGANGYECPMHASAKGKYCTFCRKADVGMACACCSGNTCRADLNTRERCASEEYVIYFASVGEKVKVGVTKKERTVRRWIEQGADFAAVVGEVEDGMFARTIERRLQEELNCANAVRDDYKIKNLVSGDRKAIERTIESFLERYPKSETPQIEDLAGHYPKIRRFEVADACAGKVLGAKGNFLFLEKEGTKIFNMKDAVGRFLFLE